MFPAGFSTRDDQYVEEAIAHARREDIQAIFNESPRLWVPYFDAPVEAELRPVAGEKTLRREPSKREKHETKKRPSCKLMKEWLRWHSDWVKADIPRVVADALGRLKRDKSERRAEIRAARRDVTRNGRRTKARRPGPLPNLKLNVTFKTGRKKIG